MLSSTKWAVRGTAILWCTSAWAQANPARQMSARELFYAAADEPASAPRPAPAKAAAAPRAARPAEAKVARKDPPKAKAGTLAKSSPPPAAPAPVPTPGGAQVSTAAYSPGRHTIPLGLRYTILKRVEGQMIEVAPDTVFHAGDRIQIKVEANDSGYLYIVSQGSSGTWKPMFPSAEIERGDNRVEKGRIYAMPPGSRFYFDEQAGEEKLFVVLSRQPEPDLEKIIYSLQGGAPAAPGADPAPGPPPAKVLYASNIQPIDDALVGRLRNVYARDLVIEKVDDEAPGANKEKAVYVVNPSGSPDSRVVADIRLVHR